MDNLTLSPLMNGEIAALAPVFATYATPQAMWQVYPIPNRFRDHFAQVWLQLGAANNQKATALVIATVRHATFQTFPAATGQIRQTERHAVLAEWSAADQDYRLTAAGVARVGAGAVGDPANVPDITPEEDEACVTIAMVGMVVLPMNGMSLVSTGHHYLSSMYRKFAGVEKQHGLSAALNTLGVSLDDARGWIWHDALHPIEIPIKRAVAMDASIRMRLNVVGQSAAAIRLPPKSGAEDLVGSIWQLMMQVSRFDPWIQFPQRFMHQQMQAIAQLNPAAEGFMANRAREEEALRVALLPHEAEVAELIGMFREMVAASGITNHTLLKAKGLTRIAAANVAGVERGVRRYAEVSRWRRNFDTARGFATRGFFGAQAAAVNPRIPDAAVDPEGAEEAAAAIVMPAPWEPPVVAGHVPAGNAAAAGAGNAAAGAMADPVRAPAPPAPPAPAPAAGAGAGLVFP